METNKASDYVDLTKPDNQPLYGTPNFPGLETGSKLTLLDVFNSNNQEFWKKKSNVFGTINIENNFPVLTQILLADYLDYDNIPLSLNLPCAEIAPMLVGIDCHPKFMMKFKKDASSAQSFYSDTGGQNMNIHNATFQVDIEAEPEVTIQVAFPFSSVKDRLPNANMDYKVQVVARLFFTTTGDNTLRMPRTPGFNLDFLKDADANAQDNAAVVWPTGDEVNDYSILWGSSEVSFTVPDETNITDERRYLKDVVVRLQKQTHTRTLFNAWYKTDYQNLLGAGVPYYDQAGQPVGQTTDVNYPAPVFRFLNYGNGTLSSINLNQFQSSTKIRPSLAVWVRIVDPIDNDKVVDMVPATIKCDMWNNQGISVASLKEVFRQYEAFENSSFNNWSVPFLRYWGDSSTEFEFTLADIGTKSDANQLISSTVFNPESYMAGDPRYNWAPEDWYQGTPGKWLDNVRGMFGTDRRDDFFMSVSNQGYLQSVYELMFIPRVRQLTPETSPTFGFLDKNDSNAHSYNGAPRTSLDDTSHYDMMWRTYRQGNTDDSGNIIDADEGWGGSDDLAKLRISSGEKGMRVNPYTDITNLFMGAIANMPMDWWAAGTNSSTTGKGYMNPKKSDFENKYLFDYESILNYNNVLGISNFMMSKFKNNVMQGDPDCWKEIFDEWSWCGLETEKYPDPLKVIRDDITINDRKFIYGYTRECFANRQQLFLVFLRAESVSLGGKSSGQLGARAVAVVWRDPRPASNVDNADIYLRNNSDSSDWRKKRKDNTRPHRTRVLFFHQFD